MSKELFHLTSKSSLHALIAIFNRLTPNSYKKEKIKGGFTVNSTITRKIVSAAISGSIFAILLGFITPDPFGQGIDSLIDYLLTFTISIPAYLVYSFPVILIYGVLTSLISDRTSNWVTKKINNKNIEMIISGMFHILFGLIFLPFSLGAAILFFITDRLLQKSNRHFNWFLALKSLAIPLAVYLSFMTLVYLEGLIFE